MQRLCTDGTKAGAYELVTSCGAAVHDINEGGAGGVLKLLVMAMLSQPAVAESPNLRRARITCRPLPSSGLLALAIHAYQHAMLPCQFTWQPLPAGKWRLGIQRCGLGWQH